MMCCRIPPSAEHPWERGCLEHSLQVEVLCKRRRRSGRRKEREKEPVWGRERPQACNSLPDLVIYLWQS